MSDTGTMKISYDLSLLRSNLFLGSSLFDCEAYKVYSDVEVWLSPDEVSTVKVDDVNADFHFAKTKSTGTWVNTPMFFQTWNKIRVEGLWASYDWTVKVDPDTVFLPHRLRALLINLHVTLKGIYLQNCKEAHNGFLGSLEVISREGFSTFLGNTETCKHALNWKETGTGMGAWGEDMFMQRCMDLADVDKVMAWDLATDSTCAASRPGGQNEEWRPNCALASTAAISPLKAPSEYFECLKATKR
jgi:hypothetical protein